MDHQTKITELLASLAQAEVRINQAVSARNKLYDDFDDYIGNDFSVVKNLAIDTVKELSAISSIAKNYLSYYNSFKSNNIFAVIELEGEAVIVEAEIHNYFPKQYGFSEASFVLYQGKSYQLENLSYIDTDPKWLEPKAKELNLKLKINKLLADSLQLIKSLKRGDEIYYSHNNIGTPSGTYYYRQATVEQAIHSEGDNGWKHDAITLTNGQSLNVNKLIGNVANSYQALYTILAELNGEVELTIDPYN